MQFERMVDSVASWKREENAPCLSYDWFYIIRARIIGFLCQFTNDSLLLLSWALWSSKRFEAAANKLSNLYLDQRPNRCQERKNGSFFRSTFHLSGTYWLVKLALEALWILYLYLLVIPNIGKSNRKSQLKLEIQA